MNLYCNSFTIVGFSIKAKAVIGFDLDWCHWSPDTVFHQSISRCTGHSTKIFTPNPTLARFQNTRYHIRDLFMSSEFIDISQHNPILSFPLPSLPIKKKNLNVLRYCLFINFAQMLFFSNRSYSECHFNLFLIILISGREKTTAL